MEERILTKIRYLPAIGRFLIVVTFLEDALRIITQWSDQLSYLHDYRHSKFHPTKFAFLYSTSTSLRIQNSHTHPQIKLLTARSPNRPQPPLPPPQRPRHDFLLFVDNNTQARPRRSGRSNRRSHNPSPGLRPDLRPELLPAQPVCHGRIAHGFE